MHVSKQAIKISGGSNCAKFDTLNFMARGVKSLEFNINLFHPMQILHFSTPHFQLAKGTLPEK
jgi:hypothetical protein